MSEWTPVKVVEVYRPSVRFGRPASDVTGEMEVTIDGVPVVTIHYRYPFIDNATQWSLAENIAKMFDPEASQLP